MRKAALKRAFENGAFDRWIWRGVIEKVGLEGASGSCVVLQSALMSPWSSSGRWSGLLSQSHLRIQLPSRPEPGGEEGGGGWLSDTTVPRGTPLSTSHFTSTLPPPLPPPSILFHLPSSSDWTSPFLPLSPYLLPPSSSFLFKLYPRPYLLLCVPPRSDLSIPPPLGLSPSSFHSSPFIPLSLPLSLNRSRILSRARRRWAP